MNNSSQIHQKVQSNGFLITRSVFDGRSGLVIHLWLRTSSGIVKLDISGEKAVFFVETEQSSKVKRVLDDTNLAQVEMKSLGLKNFSQQPVTAIYFKFLRDFYIARDALKQHKIKCYEDDIRPDDRYLMERFITAGIEFVAESISTSKGNYKTYQNVKCRRLPNQQKLSVVSLDIECSMQQELYSIGLYGEGIECVYMVANKEQQENYKNNNEDSSFIIWVEDEANLLHAIQNWFVNYDPDVVIGWNVIQFDFALLQSRFDKHHIDFSIGRDGSMPRWRTQRNSEQKFLDIAGRVVIDGIDLLKSATYSFNSFSLDNVSHELLGKGKKVDDVENRVAEITHNFHHEKVKLAEYNLEDCRLVLEIFDKTDLMAFAMLRAHLTGLSLDRVGGSVAAFTNLYLPKLHRAGYIAPNMGDGLQGLTSPGGYVMDSIPGLYQNVLVLDFKSLYPSIIKTFNIDPMGLIEGLKDKSNSIPGFDEAFFSRDKHFLPDIIESLWQERDIAKKEKNAALSQAIKIIMNSFYGILGSTGCRFFDPRLSGSITKRSHEILKTTKDWIEDKGYQVIYGDTDSIFVYVGDDKSIEQCQVLGDELADFINQGWQTQLQVNFNLKSQLEIEFETHFTQFFMPAVRSTLSNNQQNEAVQNIGTKKRYVGEVFDEDGESKLIFKGLETVRSDWTAIAKVFQQDLYKMVFDKAEHHVIKTYIQALVKRVQNGECDDQLIYRKRLRRKLSLYVKNVPPHVKAARQADEENTKHGRALKYQNKGWVSYVITLNGPQAIESISADINYQHYIDRQLKSVADDILFFLDTSFEQITDQQLSLF